MDLLLPITAVGLGFALSLRLYFLMQTAQRYLEIKTEALLREDRNHSE